MGIPSINRYARVCDENLNFLILINYINCSVMQIDSCCCVVFFLKNLSLFIKKMCETVNYVINVNEQKHSS